MKLETPYLEVDRARFVRNSLDVREKLAKDNIALRPHFKAYKSLALAEIHYDMGIRSFAAAKVSEAEVLAERFDDIDILLSSPPADAARARRLIDLTKKNSSFSCTIDHPYQLDLLTEQLSTNAAASLPLWIALDCGLNREGVRTQEQCVEIVERIGNCKQTSIAGLTIYVGHLFCDARRLERQTYLDLDRQIEPFKEILRTSNPRATISIGSSPCRNFFHLISDVSEARVGTAFFGDASSVLLHGQSAEECAATVKATVISANGADSVVIDAGSKSLARQSIEHRGKQIFGLILEYPETFLTRVNEEHGMIDCSGSSHRPKLGEVVTILPVNVPLMFALFSHAYLSDESSTKLISIDARDCRV